MPININILSSLERRKRKIEAEALRRKETIRTNVQSATAKLADLLKAGPVTETRQAQGPFGLDIPMPTGEVQVPARQSQAVKNALIDLLSARQGPEGTEAFLEFAREKPPEPTLTKVEGQVAEKVRKSGVEALKPGEKIIWKRMERKGIGKGFAPQVDLKYIPVENNRFQLMSVDEVSGATKPVIRNGKPVILTEKQVLIAEGKKAQSLINPYETTFLKKLGETEGARLTELKATALDSINSLRTISEGRSLVDQGIYAGSAANIKKTFDKWLQEVGIFIGGRKAANTEAYASMMGLQVGKIIKAFGAGTGLSDADREYAEKIVGGDITLTEDAIRRLLDINERMARFTITEYNSQAERAKSSLETKEYLRPIEMPNFTQPPRPPKPTGTIDPSQLPRNVIEAIQDAEGQEVELRNGSVWRWDVGNNKIIRVR